MSDLTPEEVARLLLEPGDPKMRMDAYYYGFERTEVGVVDAVLSAVAKAGKAYHNTENWQGDDYDAPSHEDRIQNAANEAAASIKTAVLALLTALDEARAEVERLRATHRDLTRQLGFGDNITEPQADNDTIVGWYAERCLEADEWRESQRWRDDCALAGHPSDEDCHEHDPALRLTTAEADAAAARDRETRAVADFLQHVASNCAYNGAGDPGQTYYDMGLNGWLQEIHSALLRTGGGDE